MKTTLLLPAAFACALLSLPALAAHDVASAWRAELDSLQQATGQNAGGRTRADAILRTTLEAVRHGLPDEPTPADVSREAAAAHAAHAMLRVLYPQSVPALEARLAQSLATVTDSAAAIAAGKTWGEHVAESVLAAQDVAVALNPGSFVQAAKTAGPPAPAPMPAAAAEEETIGPGRYHFTVLAGAPGAKGYLDGSGDNARFDFPGGIAVDGAGTVYVSETALGVIRKITANGEVTTLAGAAGQKGGQDGLGAAARFDSPRGLAVDPAGNVYVADSGNHTVRKIDPAGNVTTFAGVAGIAAQVDGDRAVARLDSPFYLAVDGAGNVFVTEVGGRGRIRRVSPDGIVATLSIAIPPFAGNSGSHDYSGAWPWQLVADHDGTLYAIYSDAWDFADVVRLTPAGGMNYSGTTLRPPASMSFANGVGVDAEGNVYVKYDMNPVCLFTPALEPHVRYASGNTGGSTWADLAVGPFGTIYALPYSDAGTNLGTVELGLFDSSATGPVILTQPFERTRYRNQTAEFAVWALGGTALTYQWYFDSTPLSGATSSTLALQGVQDSQAGSYSVVVSDANGSVSSRVVRLTVLPPVTGVAPDNPGGGSVPDSGAPSTGGGSCHPAFVLVLLTLVGTAAIRPSDRRVRGAVRTQPSIR
ncbi:MAG TPA: hypothetical protein VG734_20295 [Lacunisphaera sp.]|nr:hypothetical protein [Lacunisphaera sp.]